MFNFMCILRPCTSKTSGTTEDRVATEITIQTNSATPMVSCHDSTPPGPAGWYFAAPHARSSTCDACCMSCLLCHHTAGLIEIQKQIYQRQCAKIPKTISCNFGWTSEKLSMNWPDDIPLHFQVKMFQVSYSRYQPDVFLEHPNSLPFCFSRVPVPRDL